MLDISASLEELKECEYIDIKTKDGEIIKTPYVEIINNIDTEYLIIQHLNLMFPYCAIEFLDKSS